MFKMRVKTVELMKKTCDKFCGKQWVIFVKNIFVGKTNILSTFSPTNFSQPFSTHQPLLRYSFSPHSTVPITTIKYIIKEGQ